jgi:hypothetical protein
VAHCAANGGLPLSAAAGLKTAQGGAWLAIPLLNLVASAAFAVHAPKTTKPAVPTDTKVEIRRRFMATSLRDDRHLVGRTVSLDENEVNVDSMFSRMLPWRL